MLLIVKLDQGVRNGFFSENLACFVLKNNRRTDLHVYFCIRCFLYCWSWWNYVFSTSFFVSANVYAKCFILLFIASFALLRCQLFFFFQKFDGTLISCLFFPEIHSNHKPVYVFCHFFLCLTVFSHSLSSFLSSLLCIITFQIFHFDVVLFLCHHFFSQVCFTLFGFFPLFFPSTKYGRIYEIRVPLCILKSFLLSLLVTKASFLRKLASTLWEFSQNFQHLRN